MAEKIYNKLVRDKIPQVIAGSNATPITRTLSDDEFVKELKLKLIEEAKELVAAESREDKVAELADIVEVTKKIMRVEGVTWDESEVVRIQKLADRGGFEDKIFLEKVIEN